MDPDVRLEAGGRSYWKVAADRCRGERREEREERGEGRERRGGERREEGGGERREEASHHLLRRERCLCFDGRM